MSTPEQTTRSMADQCIVCLEELEVLPDAIIPSDHGDAGPVAAPNNEQVNNTHPGKSTTTLAIAMIKPCDHLLHDTCLREWSQKANSCPICRQTFNLVEVFDKVGGTFISCYDVEDKKQVAEFDINAWVEDNEEEEEEATPCLVCGDCDREDVLLLCDACDVPYHTYCIGLDRIPRGHWFCMECADEGAYALAAETAQLTPRRSEAINPRTLETVRRTRQRLRTDQWYGAWGDFSNRVHDQLGLDLDFADDEEDVHLTNWRRHQRRTAEAQRQFRQWQQRLNIAGRQGARHIFRQAAPPTVSERAPLVPLPPETPDELRAWGAFQRAQQATPSGSASRKRKSRSITASPAERSEPAREPERKLKRPRTRRVPDVAESSSSRAVASSSRQQQPSSNASSPVLRPTREGLGDGEPTFLSSLLREVEMGQSTAASPVAIAAAEHHRMNGASSAGSSSSRRSSLSPELSPSSRSSTPRHTATHSSHTPRSLPISPPPHPRSSRPGSPLASSPVISPCVPEVTRSGRDLPLTPSSDIRHPQPKRLVKVPQASDEELKALSQAKLAINRIVKSALSPHWKAAKITKEQYADVNRDVSRKLYERIPDLSLSDEEDRDAWHKIADAEVATAVRALTS